MGCGGGGCASGCGECYIDPWINEPAACRDPCNDCGQYNGQGCGSCRPVFNGVASLWGYRYDAGCGCAGVGCDSCAGACDGACDGGGCDCGHGGGMPVYGSGPMPPSEPYYIDGPHHIGGEPTPLGGSIVEDDALRDSYVPSRSKQIFRNRGPVVSRPSSTKF